MTFLQYGANKNDEIAEKLKERFDNGLSFLQKSYKRKKLWVSQIYCPRKAFLASDESGYVEINEKSATYMRMGVDMEKYAIENFKSLGALAYNEVLNVNQVDEELKDKVSGKLDAVIELQYDNTKKLFALEMKTCGKLPDKPSKEHLSQLYLYSAITGLRPILFYFSRNVADFSGLLTRFFVLDYDKTKLVFELTKMFYALNCKKEKIIPENVKVLKKYCNYCPYYNNCHKEEKYEVTEKNKELWGKSIKEAEFYLKGAKQRFKKTCEIIDTSFESCDISHLE